MPRSRWLALLVAALLCVLGGANRGRVPAHEREGSRTADEPAALTMRRGTPRVAESFATADPDASVHALHFQANEPTTVAVVVVVTAPLVPPPPSRRGSVTPRGPPSASLV